VKAYTVAGVRWVVEYDDGGRPLRETSSAGTRRYVYDTDGEFIGVVSE
jgi:YD repeat-containing protein